MAKGKLVALVAGVLIVFVVMYNNCSASKNSPAGSVVVPSGSATPTATPNPGIPSCSVLGTCNPGEPGPGVPPVDPPLVVHEGFDGLFAANQCSSPGNAGCETIMGFNSGKPIKIQKFGTTCLNPPTVSSWVGGLSEFHGYNNPAVYNPHEKTNWAPIRFSSGGHNEILMTSGIQGNVNGGMAIDFFAEVPNSGMFTMLTNLKFDTISGCTHTATPASMKGIFIGYGLSPKVGFEVYVVGSSGSGFAKGSFLPTTLPPAWYNLYFSRAADGYHLILSVWVKDDAKSAAEGKNVGKLELVDQKTFELAEVDKYNNGAAFPLGRMGINSDQTGLVNFDNFNIEW